MCGETKLAKEIEVNVDGEKVKAKSINFNVEKEQWSSYKLKDGTKLYLKAVPIEVFDTGKRDQLTNEKILIVKNHVFTKIE